MWRHFSCTKSEHRTNNNCGKWLTLYVACAVILQIGGWALRMVSLQNKATIYSQWTTICPEKVLILFQKIFIFENKELLFEMLQSTNEAFDVLHNFVVWPKLFLHQIFAFCNKPNKFHQKICNFFCCWWIRRMQKKVLGPKTNT